MRGPGFSIGGFTPTFAPAPNPLGSLFPGAAPAAAPAPDPLAPSAPAMRDGAPAPSPLPAVPHGHPAASAGPDPLLAWTPPSVNAPIGPAGPMPAEMLASIRHTLAWAKANARESWLQLVAFWSLKLPAIAGAGVSALLTGMDLKPWAVGFATAASLCVAIDGVAKLGQRQSLSRRAFYQLRALATWAVDEWLAGPKGRESPARLIARIMDRLSSEKQRIGTLLDVGLDGIERNTDTPVRAAGHRRATA